MYDAGVNLLVGTDAGTSIAHGDLAREAAEMARCMPAADVVAAATWRARRFLGAPLLAEGDPADLVVLSRGSSRTTFRYFSRHLGSCWGSNPFSEPALRSL